MAVTLSLCFEFRIITVSSTQDVMRGAIVLICVLNFKHLLDSLAKSESTKVVTTFEKSFE